MTTERNGTDGFFTRYAAIIIQVGVILFTATGAVFIFQERQTALSLRLTGIETTLAERLLTIERDQDADHERIVEIEGLVAGVLKEEARLQSEMIARSATRDRQFDQLNLQIRELDQERRVTDRTLATLTERLRGIEAAQTEIVRLLRERLPGGDPMDPPTQHR